MLKPSARKMTPYICRGSSRSPPIVRIRGGCSDLLTSRQTSPHSSSSASRRIPHTDPERYTAMALITHLRPMSAHFTLGCRVEQGRILSRAPTALLFRSSRYRCMSRDTLQLRSKLRGIPQHSLDAKDS